MNEPYPEGTLGYLYDPASNREETRLGQSIPIPSPNEVILNADETIRFLQTLEAEPRQPTPALADAVDLYRQTVKEL